jgi:peptidoglycan hydrolase-like protein with peptidoglycan-binding domain
MVDHRLELRMEPLRVNRPHRLSLLAGALLAIAMAAAGCSSSGHSNSTSSSVPSTTNAATAAANKALQQGLAEVGCYAGPIDGIVGPSTVTAIKNFQQAVGLSPDGVYGAKTEQRLQAAEKSGAKVCSSSSTITIPKSNTTQGATTTTSAATTSTTQVGTTTTSTP